MAEYLRVGRLLEAMPHLVPLPPEVQENLCKVGSAAVEAMLVLRLKEKLSPEIVSERILEALSIATQSALRIGQKLPQAEIADLNAAINNAIMVGEADFKKSPSI